MKMKSIDKLRGLVDKSLDDYANGRVSYVCGFSDIADEIEAEIAERYMRLPVDMHDAPIRVGDEIQQLNHAGVWTDAMPVIAVDESGCFALAHGRACEARTYVWGNNCRHAKLRTLEDVLRDYGDEYHKACKSDYAVNLAGIYCKYADEIRELLGVDE